MTSLWMAWLTTVATIFMAELGDKTQLATMLFAADSPLKPWQVFLASSVALVASSALAVLAGQWVSTVVPVATLRLTAGIGFMAIGGWTLWDVLKP